MTCLFKFVEIGNESDIKSGSLICTNDLFKFVSLISTYGEVILCMIKFVIGLL